MFSPKRGYLSDDKHSNILSYDTLNLSLEQQQNQACSDAKMAISNLFYNKRGATTPPCYHKTSHTIKINKINKERLCVLTEEEIQEVFKHKIIDNRLNEPKNDVQYIKFRQQIHTHSINRKIVLQDMGLSLSFANYFS